MTTKRTTRKTGFRPETHGFAFVNRWSFDLSEKERMSNAMDESIGGAVNSLGSGIGATGGTRIREILKGWLGDALPESYGLCGGMAFTSLDYYKQGGTLPRGKDHDDLPRNDTPEGKTMRSHLWKRQLESMGDNFPTLLMWMVMLHSGLPLTGAGWLLEHTREEWATLKQHIDDAHPWPICLVGSSRSPFDNHQVLAYGYDDAGDGTGTIYLYDMNCPGREQTTTLDFRGSQLEAQESCPGAARGALRGFFCEVYKTAKLPI
jgi:hypothetical protein